MAGSHGDGDGYLSAGERHTGGATTAHSCFCARNSVFKTLCKGSTGPYKSYAPVVSTMIMLIS